MTTKLTIRVSVLILMVGLLCGPLLADGNGHVKRELREYFTQLTQAREFNGSVLVAFDDEFLWKKGFGLADFETGRANNPSTVFAIASLSKAFASVGILMLEEEGLLELEDTVDLYIPEYDQAHLMTIHQLMRMSAGIPNFLDDPVLWANLDQYITPEELMETFIHKPLHFTPGSQWEYCNSCYALLGVIIERVTEMTFGEFVEARILGPLHMNRSFYDPEDLAMMNQRAVPYTTVAIDPPPLSPYLHASVAYSAGGMFSTVKDMYRWDRALEEEVLISEDSLEKMYEPGHGNYGYGFYIDTMDIDGEAYRHVWHWGSYLGYHAYFSRLVDEELTVILLLNFTSPDLLNQDQLRPVAQAVATIVLEDDD